MTPTNTTGITDRRYITGILLKLRKTVKHITDKTKKFRGNNLASVQGYASAPRAENTDLVI